MQNFLKKKEKSGLKLARICKCEVDNVESIIIEEKIFYYFCIVAIDVEAFANKIILQLAILDSMQGYIQISFPTVNNINTKSICFNKRDPVDLISNFANTLAWHKVIAD